VAPGAVDSWPRRCRHRACGAEAAAKGCPSVRRRKAKSSWPNCWYSGCQACTCAPGVVRHRATMSAIRLARALPDATSSSSSRLLPRSRRQPAGQGRIGPADFRQPSSAGVPADLAKHTWCSTTTMPRFCAMLSSTCKEHCLRDCRAGGWQHDLIAPKPEFLTAMRENVHTTRRGTDFRRGHDRFPCRSRLGAGPFRITPTCRPSAR